MTIKELYDLFDDNCTELNTQGHYTSTDECKAIRMVLDVIKELQAHRYAWAKLREDIRDEAEFAYADFDEYKYEVLGIDDVDDLPNDDYRYGMERALELIDIYRPKEGDNND